MQKCTLVTPHQADILANLGFHEEVCAYRMKLFEKTHIYINNYPADWNKRYRSTFQSMPTVDETIDWLRKKHNVIIYNRVPPYVCPFKGRIIYIYDVKKCYPKHGWNSRIQIASLATSYNIYAAKRMAITKALKWILSHKSGKSK